MRVLTMLNQKGGVGKTSTCYHVAGSLARAGRRVLLVDNDPQASLTQGVVGPEATRRIDPSRTIASIYGGHLPFPEDVVMGTGIKGVDLVPGSRHAKQFNRPDAHLSARAERFGIRGFLAEASSYDLCIIDCPPNLHLCSWASLVASDGIVVPLQPEDYGAQGVADVNESIAAVRDSDNPLLLLTGYVITMANLRTNLHRLYQERLRAAYGDLVFSSTVPHSVDYAEAIAARVPVSSWKPRGAASRAMDALADELWGRLCGAAGKEAA